MGVKELLQQKVAQTKSFVTGKPAEQTMEQRYPEEAHGKLSRMEAPREESGAAQVAKATRGFINRQSSSTFKRATGYNQAPKKITPDKIKGNIPRTRVPREEQKPNFINRQIDLSYQAGEGYISHIINHAFSFEKKSKPIFEVQGLPKGGVKSAFETAVGYQPKEKKKFSEQKFTISIKPAKKKL